MTGVAAIRAIHLILSSPRGLTEHLEEATRRRVQSLLGQDETDVRQERLGPRPRQLICAVRSRSSRVLIGVVAPRPGAATARS
jgi:hypothetical protein